ncbi:Pseudouridine synthase [Lactobacillus gigeriorum DSM 23908 = CRBIP 24.85]|uniref:Pseudouridine synthase n=2 Tax=Lactobacillus gigeriorum DSM 23908 = CRBIP 24.85 TaxID=1423751 RepID=I7J3M7_9LACO|nr:Pseudouridine synthase [Lactobacillus gigeriorum DSM 23908 = CRBIP 24.85]
MKKRGLKNRMTNDYNLTVDKAGIRLDKYIADQIEDLSRTRVGELIKDGEITVNNKKEKASYKVILNDEVKVHVPALKPLSLEPENIPLDIIYEDDDVIVVNKPQGMVVHPSAGHPDHTLVNALLYHTKDLASSPEGFRPGIVHRIDKDTSGLLMIAKTPTARESLEYQLANKINKRLYLAIVHGNFGEEAGKIDAPIGRNPLDRKKMAVVENGKHAVTHFKVLEQYQGFSLIQCQLETGRTHQIRVHLSYIGHPVAGDPLYGLKNTLKGNGQFLHAQVLGFNQPTTNDWLEFSTPVPTIFHDTLETLRKRM